MFSRLILEATVYTDKQLVVPQTLQWALVGRSNVGKSSLLNCLAGVQKLAHTSSTPGKTRSLNFYRVAEKTLYLVDLPGYGYAAISKKEHEHWAKLVNRYLTSTRTLAGVVLLLDSRLPPQALDLELARFIQAYAINLLPVLTKSDKCNQRERNSRQKEWAALLSPYPTPLPFSSKTGLGRDTLWHQLFTKTTPESVFGINNTYFDSFAATGAGHISSLTNDKLPLKQESPPEDT
ncbi:putative GTP-binding protein EngB [Desulfovibrionales bacterium]